MRRQSRQDPEEDELNLTPMLDIVFIMLIFFIVTASFVKQTGVEVNQPGAVTAQSKKSASILIGVTEEEEIWIDKRQVDIRQVRANVQRLLAENPQASVLIQADKNSKTGLVIKVQDEAKLAGVKNVSVAAEPL